MPHPEEVPLSERLADYLLAHTSPEHPYLHSLYRATNTQLLRPRMASGHQQGLLLKMICTMLRPRIVVEIGTYSGYSALALASGLSADAVVHTFEINDEQEEFTRPWLEQSPFPARIELHIGDALTLLPTLNIHPDLAFIDANKRHYEAYYDLLLPLLTPGGFILADNTLWDNHVLDPAYDHDAQTVAIRSFNDRIVSDPRVEVLPLPLRDGLTLIHKL